MMIAKRGRGPFKRFGTLDTWVVGVQYYSDADLDTEQEVIFERDPDNPFDANAVAVYTTAGHQIGHLPRYDAEYFSPLMLDGVVALKGRIEPGSRGDRVRLKLDIHATRKASELIEPDNRNDWRAIYHNLFVELWRRLPAGYSATTLRAFRDRFRVLAHEQPLYAKTQFLYRMLKAHIEETEKREIDELREGLVSAVHDMTFAPFQGWPELRVAPLFGTVAKRAKTARKTRGGKEKTLALREAGTGRLLSLLPDRCPYPEGARGAVILVHGAWFSMDWFEEPEHAQVYWYPMILQAAQDALLKKETAEEHQEGYTPSSLKERIKQAFGDAKIKPSAEETDAGMRIGIDIGTRDGYAMLRGGRFVRIHIGEEPPHAYHGEGHSSGA